MPGASHRRSRALPIIGWREWVSLPDLGIDVIKAKVDTGARSSSLHAFDIEVFRRGPRRYVRFKVHPLQRNTWRTVTAVALLHGERRVRNTSGQVDRRPVIRTPVEVDAQRWTIEITLARRDEMGFRMLLGRQALRGRFLLNPGRSYLAR
jgi:hypothetical protein